MTQNPLYAPPPDSSPPPLIASQIAKSDGKGNTVAAFTATAGSWYVNRITVTSDTDGTAYVYVGAAGQYTPDALVSGTWSAQFDENDAVQPYWVPQGMTLSVLFSNGGNCTARIEYVEQ